jgi:thioredoxin-like negative regulator of GroEL
VVAVGDANFDQEVVQSKLPVVCLVSSEAAARAVVPLILQASAQHTDIKFVFLNSDNDMALAQELGVTKVPTMLPIFQGKLLEAPMVGAPTPQQAADFFRRVSEMGRTMGTMAQTAAAMNELIAQGEVFLSEGTLDKAAQCFEQAVQAGGPNPAAFAGLALIALQAGEVETCESILKTVQDFKDHDKIPLCKRALSSFALSKALSSVIEELKGAQIVPGTPEATYRDAVQECQKGNAELAIAGLVKLVKDKSHPGAKDLLFKILSASPPDVANAGRKKLAQALFV